MATNTQLKFYKVNGIPTSDLTIGGIYFDKKTGFIHVATSATKTDVFGSKLSDAQWNADASKLSLTKADGSSLELDFSDMASSSAVTAEFAKHLGRIQTLEDQIGFTGVEGERQWANNIEFYKTYTQKYDAAGGSITASAVTANTIGKEVDNLDVALHDLSVSVGKMATSEVVGELTNRVGIAESDIDNLQDVVFGYSGKGAIETAIENAQSAATTTIKKGNDEKFITITDTFGEGEGKTANHAYTITTSNVAKASELSALTTTVNDHITKDFNPLKIKVDALSSATHFEGVVTWDPSTADISDPVDGNFTINDKTYQSGDIVIYKPAAGGSKEYILDGASKTFIELGDTTAIDAAVSDLNGRVGELEDWKSTTSDTVESLGLNKLDKSEYNTFTSAEGDFGKLQSSVATKNAANDTRFGNIDSITGHPSVAGADGKVGYQPHTETEVTYIVGATSLDDADVKLDTAIKALDTRVGNTEKEVASVVGDSSTIQVTTNERVATVSALTGAITSNTSGLAKAADVYEALCWVEFN